MTSCESHSENNMSEGSPYLQRTAPLGTFSPIFRRQLGRSSHEISLDASLVDAESELVRRSMDEYRQASSKRRHEAEGRALKEIQLLHTDYEAHVNKIARDKIKILSSTVADQADEIHRLSDSVRELENLGIEEEVHKTQLQMRFEEKLQEMNRQREKAVRSVESQFKDKSRSHEKRENDLKKQIEMGAITNETLKTETARLRMMLEATEQELECHRELPHMLKASVQKGEALERKVDELRRGMEKERDGAVQARTEVTKIKKELQEVRSQKEGEIMRRADDKTLYSKDLGKVEQTLRLRTKEIIEKENRLKNLEDALELKRKEMADKDKEMRVLSEDASFQKKLKEHEEQRHHDKDRQLLTLTQEVANANRDARAKETECDKLRERVDNLNGQVSAFKEQVSQVNMEKGQLQGTIESLRAEVLSLKNTIEQQADTHRENISKKDEEIHHLQSDLMYCRKNYAELTQEKEKVEGDLERCEVVKKRLADSARPLYLKRQRAQMFSRWARKMHKRVIRTMILRWCYHKKARQAMRAMQVYARLRRQRARHAEVVAELEETHTEVRTTLEDEKAKLQHEVDRLRQAMFDMKWERLFRRIRDHYIEKAFGHEVLSRVILRKSAVVGVVALRQRVNPFIREWKHFRLGAAVRCWMDYVRGRNAERAMRLKYKHISTALNALLRRKSCRITRLESMLHWKNEAIRNKRVEVVAETQHVSLVRHEDPVPVVYESVDNGGQTVFLDQPQQTATIRRHIGESRPAVRANPKRRSSPPSREASPVDEDNGRRFSRIRAVDRPTMQAAPAPQIPVIHATDPVMPRDVVLPRGANMVYVGGEGLHGSSSHVPAATRGRYVVENDEIVHGASRQPRSQYQEVRAAQNNKVRFVDSSRGSGRAARISPSPPLQYSSEHFQVTGRRVSPGPIESVDVHVKAQQEHQFHSTPSRASSSVERSNSKSPSVSPPAAQQPSQVPRRATPPGAGEPMPNPRMPQSDSSSEEISKHENDSSDDSRLKQKFESAKMAATSALPSGHVREEGNVQVSMYIPDDDTPRRQPIVGGVVPAPASVRQAGDSRGTGASRIVQAPQIDAADAGLYPSTYYGGDPHRGPVVRLEPGGAPSADYSVVDTRGDGRSRRGRNSSPEDGGAPSSPINYTNLQRELTALVTQETPRTLMELEKYIQRMLSMRRKLARGKGSPDPSIQVLLEALVGRLEECEYEFDRRSREQLRAKPRV